MKNMIALVCIKCGAEHEPAPTTYTCKKCGGIMDLKYDYKYVRKHMTKDKLLCRPLDMWRYTELLPVAEGAPRSRLRTGWSPLYHIPEFAERLGLGSLYIKDDGINPTASLKDRASAVAVAKAVETKAEAVACSSTGNAASSLAGHSAAIGMKAFIFVPERAPKAKVSQLMVFGANVISVIGSYADTFKLSAEAIEKFGWYNRNAAINPYLIEGKKTVALEIAEQLGWNSPDYVVVSVGDGCTIAGVWKGFKDLYEIGMIDKLPKIISVQATGCYPINRAFEENKPLAWMDENTIADSIAVGAPRNPDKALAAIRESCGIAVNVTDDEILSAMKVLGSYGIFGEPAASAGTAGLIKAAQMKLLPPDAKVVSLVTGSGLKDSANAIKAAGEPVRIEPRLELLPSY